MKIEIDMTDVQQIGLEHVTSLYNEEKAKSVVPPGSHVAVTADDYLKARVSDVLNGYVGSYESHQASKADNVKLYHDVLKNKDNPLVAEALRNLMTAVESTKES